MKRFIACLCAILGLMGSFGGSCEEVTVPELSIYRRPIPDNEAINFVRGIKVGFNLGNTFEAYNDSFKGNDLKLETSWVGVETTEALIQLVCDAGFNAIRIPVSWHNHVDSDFIINEAWLNRVATVVDWAYSRGMYVILNTHHDVYPEYYYPSSEYLETSEKYISTIWAQLSEKFEPYGEKLIFESMNEPRAKDTSYEWTYDGNNAACVDSLNCINRLNQVFVDTVRASGGNNESRYLMVPSYAAAAGNAVRDAFVLPTDSADNKIIVSTHAYSPYSFALQDGGVKEFSTNLYGAQAREIVQFTNALYDKYVSQGIPVIMGEFGARDKNNLQARVNFTAVYTAIASARCIPCFWWDNGAHKGSGEVFAIVDRKKLTWSKPEIVEALMKYTGYDTLSDPE